MSLSILYGSTVWIVTAVSSAQLAFPGAIEQAAALTNRVTSALDSGPARNCPYCARGDCILCGQSAFRMDYEGCGSYGVPAFDAPCYAPPFTDNSFAASSSAPRATEPDDRAIVDASLAASHAVAEPDRGGILAALSTAAERAPGAGLVRQSLSAGVKEASRALALARQWLASPTPVATVSPPPANNPTEASEKLRQWFASDTPSNLSDNAQTPAAESLESNPQPAVTNDLEATTDATRESATVTEIPVAEIDSLVPTEAFPPVTANAETFIDWEAEVAKAHLDRLHAECGQMDDGNDGDPRHDLVTPTIRTAAYTLESLGRAAINLSAQLRTMAEKTAIR